MGKGFMRGITGFAARRPVTIFMLLSVVILLGGIALHNMREELLPNIEVPYVVIVTPYMGAAPEEVEDLVTNKIESAIQLVNGIKSVNSMSYENFSLIMIEFNWGTNLEYATAKVKQAIDTFSSLLPQGVNPIVVQFNPAILPLYILSISSEDKNALRTAIPIVESALRKVPGVANLEEMGNEQRIIRVLLDNKRLKQFKLGADTVVNALSMYGAKWPVGDVRTGKLSYPVSVDLRLHSIEELKNLIVGVKGLGNLGGLLSASNGMGGLPSGAQMPSLGSLNFSSLLKGKIPIPVRLKQVAEVEDTCLEPRGYVRVNGKPSIALLIQKQGGANDIKVARAIRKELDRLEKKVLPPTVHLETISDQSQFTVSSINGLLKNLIIGAIVATIIIFIFLRSISATIVIGFAIPLSVATAFVLMYFSNMSLDLMTLGGLTLAVGMLVDNSIVVLENIYRYLEAKSNPITASEVGGAEVGGAIVASTLTTIAVFLPIAFTSGFIAQMFKYFALAVTYSLLGSLFVALLIVPASTATFLRPKVSAENILKKKYRKLLGKAFKRKGLVLTVAFAIFAVSLAVVLTSGMELLPSVDSGQFTVTITLPPGTPAKETSVVMSKVERFVEKERGKYGVETFYANIGQAGGISQFISQQGENTGVLTVTLKPKSQRNVSTKYVAAVLRKRLKAILPPDSEFEVSIGGLETGTLFGAPVQIDITGKDLNTLKRISQGVKDKIASVKGVINPTSSLSENKKVIVVKVNNNAALFNGVLPFQVASQLNLLLQGQDKTRVYSGGESVDVYVQMKDGSRLTVEDLKRHTVNSMFGKNVYIGSIANFNLTRSPVEITHVDGKRIARVTAKTSGRSLSKIGEDIKRILDKMKFPVGYTYEITGQQYMMYNTIKKFIFSLLVGIVLMYMIMAAQFESFVQPLVIFFTLPLAIIGVSLVLLIGRMHVNAVILIGIITLAGIVVNNGIVMVTYINQLRERGKEKMEAILDGAATRLRPILMTSLTTMIALVPVAFSTESGSELENPMALSILFGLAFTTLSMLFVVPIIYDIFDRISRKFVKKP